jgi:hypothetical protein
MIERTHSPQEHEPQKRTDHGYENERNDSPDVDCPRILRWVRHDGGEKTF